MGEYEDRYPDAYGHGETIEENADRHFTGTGLSRQTRDLPERAQPRQSPVFEHRRMEQTTVERPAQDICEEVSRQLSGSRFIDASGIAVTATGSEVTLEGTINSLMAISLAKALASNVPGVSRVQVRLKVAPPRERNPVAAPAQVERE